MSASHREIELQTQIKECQERLALLALEREAHKPGDTLKSLIRQTAQQARWLDLYRRELSNLRNKKMMESQISESSAQPKLEVMPKIP